MKVFVSILFIILFLGCTRQNSNRLVEQEPYENQVSQVSDEVIETVYVSGIREIATSIFYDNSLSDTKFNSMDEAAKLFNSFRIVNEYVYQSIHDDTVFVTMYTIEADHYILSVRISHNSDGSFSLRIDEVFLDGTNYLDLFPYRTMEEYLADNNFGWVYRKTENEIEYSDMDPDYPVLKFENGLLHSMKMNWYFGG